MTSFFFDKNIHQRQEKSSLNDPVRILLLIPLNSDEVLQPATSRFVNYYAGMLVGLKTLEDEGYAISLKVIDLDEGATDTTLIKQTIDTFNPNIIIGPYKKEDIQKVVSYCKEKSIPLISPWHTSSRITNDNPYYIQLKPNLRQHFSKLVEETTKQFEKGDVTVLGVDSEDFKGWLDFLQQKAKTLTGKDQFFNSYLVHKDSLLKGPTAFTRFLRRQKPQAVLIPNYSFKDEQLVHQMLKRLSSEKGERPLTVFGMPLILESEKIEFEQYHMLDMQVVISDFIDERQAEIKNFRQNYLSRFGEIPTNEAVKGYDLMLFLGYNYKNQNQYFVKDILGKPIHLLQLTVLLEETISEIPESETNTSAFDFYENKHLDIIEFREKRWQRKLN